MEIEITPEPAVRRGMRRLHSTVALLRSRATDHEEAAYYLREEARLVRLLAKQMQPEAVAAEAAEAA